MQISIRRVSTLKDASADTTQNSPFFAAKGLASHTLRHTPLLWLNPESPFNALTICCLISVTGINWTDRDRERERENPVQSGSHFLLHSFSLLLSGEENQHQRHSVLLMDVPRMPRRQGNHLK